MKKNIFPGCLFVLVLSIVAGPDLIAHPETSHGQSIESAGSSFVKDLTDEQRRKALRSIDDSTRTDWSFFPGDRAGVSLADLRPDQRQNVHKLLQSSLSETGYLKVNQILHIEDILGRMENYDGYDSGKYFTVLFGEPSEDSVWGYRFEGHHLSLNYTFHDGEMVSSTPAFFGANPAVVPRGPYAGKETLVQECKLARSLVHALKKPVREQAIFRSEALREIVTEQEEKVELTEMKGVPMSRMSASNQEKLKALIRVYTGNFTRTEAKRLTGKFLDAAPEQLYFGWAGSTRAGDPHYYRVQTPEMIIEFDNVQDGANHIHSVIRSFDGDFGRDVLAEHYENSSHHEDE
jgi:hypothetical protein